MPEKHILHDTQATNDRMRALIARCRVDNRYMHKARNASYKQEIVDACRGMDMVLDVGKCMREYHDRLECGRADTLDINDFGDYPNIVADLCQPFPKELEARYDAVIALSILEHVYDPLAAADNIRLLLKPGGKAFVYVPYLYRYHAPVDLKFQDYCRFSRDALAYMFRDFSDVTLYPVRGRYSSVVNLLRFWKRHVEKRAGSRLNRILDLPASEADNLLQASGYNVTAVK